MLSDGAPTVTAAGCTHHCRTSFSETGTNRKKVNQQTEHITVPTDPLLPSVYSLFQGPTTAYRLRVQKIQGNVEGGGGGHNAMKVINKTTATWNLMPRTLVETYRTCAVVLCPKYSHNYLYLLSKLHGVTSQKA